MSELEDLRDRTFSWKYLSGFPLDVLICEGKQEVGRLWRPTNNKPVIRAVLAEINWLIHEWSGVGPFRYEILFADGPILGEGHNHFARFQICLDGQRVYSLRKDSYGVSSLFDDRGTDAIIFHRDNWHDDAPKSGDVIVSREVHILDAPPLIVIGLSMALTGRLFQTRASGY